MKARFWMWYYSTRFARWRQRRWAEKLDRDFGRAFMMAFVQPKRRRR